MNAAELAMRFGAIVVGAIASLGFVAFVGAVILWSRFEAAELPADQAVAVQPREDLVTVGGIALVVFVLGGLLAVLVLKLLDKDGNATLRTRNGLLVVMLLEIIAAFLFEQWDGTGEWLPLVGAAVVGIAALAGFLELAARSVARDAKDPFWRFLKRVRTIFTKGAPDLNRARLWTGLLALSAAVAVIAAVGDVLSRVVIGGLLLLIGAVVFTIRRAPPQQRQWYHPFTLRPNSPAEKTWALLLICLAIAASAGAVLARGSGWVAAVALIALLFVGMNLGVAHVTERFVWYGVCVFVSIALFGTAFSVLRAREDPQGQGLALLRINDTEPVCGIYVAETDERLYYGRVDSKGSSNVRDLRAESGRLLWVPRDRLAASEIGPLQPIDEARATALRLRTEVAENREPAERGAKAASVASTRLPGNPTGADPCGPQPASVEQPLSPEREMAERFQPRLLMSRNDGFWPVSLLTIFKFKRRGDVLCREPGCVPVRSEAELPFVGGETQWLEYPADFDSVKQQRQQVRRALGGAEDPYRTSREYFLMTKSEQGTTTLQYWFFYPFNYQPLAVGGLRAGYHEGDFEHVDVLVARDGQPRMVWMARHDDEGQPFLWNESALKRHGRHVDVYPARGSHASYESCINQRRRKAPLGLINDRPECGSTKRFVFEPGQVPLSDLSRTRWACWGGRFGHISGSTSKAGKLYEADGPKSPLWQQRTRGDKPCDGLTPPRNLVSGGEEPLAEDIAAKIAERADRLDAHLGACEDWQRPQPQGAYVMACQPEELARWMQSGLGVASEPRLRVLDPPQPATKRAWPLAVRRDALAPTFHDWRIRSEQEATITVYATCLAQRRPIEATFKNAEIVPGRDLRIDDRVAGLWRLIGGERVIEARPRLAEEAKDGPAAPREDRLPSTICSDKR